MLCGFLLLWADGMPELGVLHLDFRLRGGGEQVGLIQHIGTDTVFIDSLTYSSQSDGISLGRITDGNNQWMLFSVTTPGYSNSAMSPVNDLNNNAVRNQMKIYPNPFVNNLTINLDLTSGSEVFIDVTDLAGRVVKTITSGSLVLPPGIHQFKWDARDNNNSQLPTGLYFIRLISDKNYEIERVLLIR